MFKNYTNNLFKKKYRPLIHNDLWQLTIHNNIFHINKCLTIKLHNYENEHKASASLNIYVGGIIVVIVM